MLKAIPTRYAGCFFRSRLEARWAVFFSTLGLKWEYEPEGFELPSGRYLPDFLIEGRLWAEVKRDGAPDSEFKKALAMAGHPGATVAMLSGVPEVRSYPYAETLPDGTRRVDAFAFVSGGNKYTPAYYGWGEIAGAELPSWMDCAAERDKLAQACTAAKSASFEFGESGPAK